MEDKTFIVHQEWLENIRGLPVEQQDKIISEFVRYGVGLELEHTDDPVIQAFVNMLKGRIDYSINKYLEKLNASKTAGRKKKINDQQIYDLANQGKTSSEIASLLDISKSSVDHSEGWRKRNEKDFVF